MEKYDIERMEKSYGIKLGQILEKKGEIFKVITICEEPTVGVKHLLTGKFENHVIACRNFAEFNKLEGKKKREALYAVIQKFIEQMKIAADSSMQIGIADDISKIIKELKDSEE